MAMRLLRTPTLVAACVANLVLAGLVLVGGSASAGAASTTLHFFQKNTLQMLTDSAGKPVPSSASLAAGDVLVSDDLDYVGNHTHHASGWTATDHLVCSIADSSGDAICFGEFAIGGSLIYADGALVSFSATSSTVELTG